MGGRRQTAAGELAQEGLNPAVVRPPEDAQRQAQRERAAPQSRAVSETHHRLQGNPKHDAQGMEPKRTAPPASAARGTPRLPAANNREGRVRPEITAERH